MKKPKRSYRSAGQVAAEQLGCKEGTYLVLITQADFERLWKLAKEALHTSAATESGR